MKGNHVWVVEQWDFLHQKWYPTTNVALTKRDAASAMRTCHKNNPSEAFRIKPYMQR